MPKKYALPLFLSGVVSQETYGLWLRRKAQAHVKRDRRRRNVLASGTAYREAIHGAVVECVGRDAYTGESLRWELISQYDNYESRENRRHYRKRFALLPTVDHIGDGTDLANFKICGWRTNAANNDLDLSKFISLCQAVLTHNGFAIQRAR